MALSERLDVKKADIGLTRGNVTRLRCVSSMNSASQGKPALCLAS